MGNPGASLTGCFGFCLVISSSCDYLPDLCRNKYKSCFTNDAVFDHLSAMPLIDWLSDVILLFWGKMFHFNYSVSAETPRITVW
jgi:hypothetical protein